ncbi:hypothetical protein SLA2020_451610 [Shorea laevis]
MKKVNIQPLFGKEMRSDTVMFGREGREGLGEGLNPQWNESKESSKYLNPYQKKPTSKLHGKQCACTLGFLSIAKKLKESKLSREKMNHKGTSRLEFSPNESQEN